MTDIRWLDATGVDLEPFAVNEHGFGTGPAIEAKAVALAGAWLLVERQNDSYELIPEHRVARVRLSKESTRFKYI